jgi:peptidoglycan LD-endopeptidase LytH
MSRGLIPILLLVAGACSQRAPYRVVSSPAAPPSRASHEPSRATPPPLSSVALDPDVMATIGSLYFPIAGMDGAGLTDSFGDPRDSGERRHNAIDIMAPRGTAVLSVQDGRVLKLANSPKGGISIYATDAQARFVFYYAHLDAYHSAMADGRPLMRGDTIGYVGTTGNAPANVPHLHFQLMRMPADGRYWNGEPLNPFLLLRRPDSTAWR